MKKNIAALITAAAMAMCAVLCGCGAAGGMQDHTLSASSGSAVSSQNKPVPTPSPSGESDDSGSTTHTSTVRNRLNAMKGGDANTGSAGTSAESEAAESPKPETSSTADASTYDAAAIAAIAEMKADVEGIENKRNCVVSVEDDHNPYDVVWDYGWKYDAFVEAVDKAGIWDILFDIDFYTEHYPMLALQYHNDEDLLLEHFQTVGIHEGRQGSDAFNVAAYMENCSAELTKSFGEHYECYYFYWALNQESEAEVNARADGHPIQMCVKLTEFQAYELRKVNEYRAEVGADPVSVHPELLAFAGYRAWCDYTGSYEAHEWFYSHLDYIDSVLADFGADKIAENTVYGNCMTSGPAIPTAALNYRYSESHYAAMVNPAHHWFGCTNIYWGPNDSVENRDRFCEYDMYLDRMDSYNIGEQ